MSEFKPETSVIIVNYNGKRFLKDCINSVLKQTYKNFEIIFVDNASSDRSVEYMKQEYKKQIKDKKIKIVITTENKGYAGGANVGVSNSDKASKYITLLNNDTTVNKNWLKFLVETICKNEGAGMVTSLVLVKGYEEYIKRLLFKERKMSTQTLCGDTVAIQNNNLNKYVFPIPFAGGCSVIYKKRIIDLPFDENYFAYGEDIYHSWLIRLKGYDIITELRSKVIHYGGSTKNINKKINEISVFNGTKNLMMNYFIFYNFFNIIKIFPLFVLTQVGHMVYEPKKIVVILKAYIWCLINIKNILNKRRKIQNQRKVKDKEIIKLMSYKIYDESQLNNSKYQKIILRCMNTIFYVYCFIFCIKTIEFK